MRGSKYIFAVLLLLAPVWAGASTTPAAGGAVAPFLSWSTFLGGAKYDYPTGIALDPDGNIYVAGDSQLPWGSPIRSFAGGHEAFVAKLSPDGNLLWSTFLGGTGYDLAGGLAVDSAGSVTVIGESDAPWGTPLHPFSGRNDAFVAKLNTDGDLLWNSFYGGTGYDEGSSIALDSSAGIYMTGTSDAAWGAPVRSFSGGNDAFVAKLSVDGSILWNTFLGSGAFDPGGNGDRGTGLAVDPAGQIYVTGSSAAAWGAPVSGFAGGANDPFVAKLAADGSLLWNTFLGKPLDEQGKAIAVDAAGNVYVAGGNIAGRSGATASASPDRSAFVARLNTNGGLVWKSSLGGATYYYAAGLALDPGGNATVVGTNSATWLGTTASPQVVVFDAFVAKFNANGTLQWDYPLGSDDHDYGWAVAVNPQGAVFAAGSSCATWGSPIRRYTQNADPFVAVIKEGYNLAIGSGAHGTTDPAPGTYLYSSGNAALISAVADAGYMFDKWTGDVPAGQQASSAITVSMTAAKSLQANFKAARKLTISAGPFGTTNPAPGTYFHETGKSVSVTAVPNANYVFEGWEGDVPADQKTSATITLLMNADKSVRAKFGSIQPPLNLTAARLANRSLTQREFIVDLVWTENPANAVMGIAGYRVYQLTGGAWSKLADLPPDQMDYRARRVLSSEQTFGVAAVSSSGLESAKAQVTK